MYTKGSGENAEDIREDVLLKRSSLPLIGDWGRIYPPLNEDGSYNWMNTIFGGRKNLIKLLAVMFVLALLYWQVTGVLGANKKYMDGSKYIIIEIGAFDTFCKESVYENGGSLINIGNLTIVNFTNKG